MTARRVPLRTGLTTITGQTDTYREWFNSIRCNGPRPDVDLVPTLISFVQHSRSGHWLVTAETAYGWVEVGPFYRRRRQAVTARRDTAYASAWVQVGIYEALELTATAARASGRRQRSARALGRPGHGASPRCV